MSGDNYIIQVLNSKILKTHFKLEIKKGMRINNILR